MAKQNVSADASDVGARRARASLFARVKSDPQARALARRVLRRLFQKVDIDDLECGLEIERGSALRAHVPIAAQIPPAIEGLRRALANLKSELGLRRNPRAYKDHGRLPSKREWHSTVDATFVNAIQEFEGAVWGAGAVPLEVGLEPLAGLSGPDGARLGPVKASSLHKAVLEWARWAWWVTVNTVAEGRLPPKVAKEPEGWLRVSEAARATGQPEWRISRACGLGIVKAKGSKQSRRIEPASLLRWAHSLHRQEPRGSQEVTRRATAERQRRS